MKALKRIALAAALVAIAFPACKNANSPEDGQSATQGDGSNGTTQVQNEFFAYNANTKKFEGSATWTAANNPVGLAKYIAVDKMTFKIIDASNTERWSKDVEAADLESDDQTSSITGAIATDDFEVFKWADVPGVKVRAEISFTASSVTDKVKEQTGLAGLNAKDVELSLDDYVIANVNAKINDSSSYKALVTGFTNVAAGASVKFKTVKITVGEKTFTSDIDWSNKGTLDLYAKIGKNSSKDWYARYTPTVPLIGINDSDNYINKSVACYNDATAEYKNDGLQIEINGITPTYYTHMDVYATVLEDSIDKYEFPQEEPLTITVLSTTGNSYTITTTIQQVLDECGFRLEGDWFA